MGVDIFQLLASGGDLATIGICLALWKIDRRLLLVEKDMRELKS